MSIFLKAREITYYEADSDGQNAIAAKKLIKETGIINGVSALLSVPDGEYIALWNETDEVLTEYTQAGLPKAIIMDTGIGIFAKAECEVTHALNGNRVISKRETYLPFGK